MFTGELSFSCLIREICTCLMGVGITSTVNGVGCVEAPGFPPADVVFTRLGGCGRILYLVGPRGDGSGHSFHWLPGVKCTALFSVS